VSFSEESILATVPVVSLSADKTKPILQESNSPSSRKRGHRPGKTTWFHEQKKFEDKGSLQDHCLHCSRRVPGEWCELPAALQLEAGRGRDRQQVIGIIRSLSLVCHHLQTPLPAHLVSIIKAILSDPKLDLLASKLSRFLWTSVRHRIIIYQAKCYIFLSC